jgi:hypothetical protein
MKQFPNAKEGEYLGRRKVFLDTQKAVSMFYQTLIILLEFTIMLVLTGGNPPGEAIVFSFIIGMATVFILEYYPNHRNIIVKIEKLRLLKPLIFSLAASVTFGVFGKWQIETLSFKSNAQDSVKGDNVGGNKAAGVRDTVDNYSGGSATNGSQTIVNAQPGSTIAINPGDPKYDNKQLPNVSEKLSESQPANLASFKTALPFTQDMLLTDYGRFTYPSSDKVLIQDRPFFSKFKLTGDNAERKTGFNLSGKQKAIFLQFGLPDLQQRRGDTLIYDVSVVASSQTSRKIVWSGKVIYGSKDQIISLPFEAADATTLIIKYTIVQGADERPLHITRAESLYD